MAYILAFSVLPKLLRSFLSNRLLLTKMFWRVMKLGGWEGGLSMSKKEAVDAVEPQYLSLWASSVFRVSFTLHLALNPLQPSTTDMICIQKLQARISGPKIFFCVIFTDHLDVKPFFIESDNAKQRFVITLCPEKCIKYVEFPQFRLFSFLRLWLDWSPIRCLKTKENV